ncbi:MAG: hypothetical protein ACRC4T_17145 [Cetobacterium sp.]
MILTNFQKKIVKKIVKFNPNEMEYNLKSLIEYIFTMKELKDIGVEINKTEIKVYKSLKENSTKECILLRRKSFELFSLIYTLIEKNYISCINIEKDGEEIFKYNFDIQNEITIIIPLKKTHIQCIHQKLYEFIYISSTLEEYKKNRYRTKEELEIFYIKLTLWATIVASIIGIIVQYYIAKKINTVVEFADTVKPLTEVIINLK